MFNPWMIRRVMVLRVIGNPKSLSTCFTVDIDRLMQLIDRFIGIVPNPYFISIDFQNNTFIAGPGGLVSWVPVDSPRYFPAIQGSREYSHGQPTPWNNWIIDGYFYTICWSCTDIGYDPEKTYGHVCCIKKWFSWCSQMIFTKIFQSLCLVHHGQVHKWTAPLQLHRPYLLHCVDPHCNKLLLNGSPCPLLFTNCDLCAYQKWIMWCASHANFRIVCEKPLTIFTLSFCCLATAYGNSYLLGRLCRCREQGELVVEATLARARSQRPSEVWLMNLVSLKWHTTVIVGSYSSAVHLGCSCLKLLLYLLVLLLATKIWFLFLLGSFGGIYF